MQEFKILSIDSGSRDLETYDPRLDPQKFEVWNEWCVDITVGIGDNHGADFFYFNVCSKEWVNKYLPLWDKYLLIVDDWDMKEIISQINLLIKECTEDTWEKTAKKLSKFMMWEFDDYQP